MAIQRARVEDLAGFNDLDALNLRYDSIDDAICALLSYQRTKHISRTALIAWEAGDRAPLLAEARDRRQDIVRGAFLEIYREYLPLRDALKPRTVGSVCDIGCGQAINDVFLQRDFAPHFTLVDIEETEDQYHFWADHGSGYASLDAARRLLADNGADTAQIETVNPLKTDWAQIGHGFHLVTSLYSCGFHYPVDDYIGLFLDTIASGGAVVLDLRKSYLDERSDGISQLRNAGQEIELINDRKSSRILFSA